MRAPLSPELRLGIAPGCFRPSEDLLYLFAHTLGNLIALRGSDRQAAPSGLRLQGNMRPDPGLPGIALEGPGIVAFVGAKCGAALYLELPDHLGGRLAFGSASCMGQLCRGSRALPVLHEDVPHIAELSWLAPALAIEPGIWIGRRGMRLVRPRLAVEVVQCIATTNPAIRTSAAVSILRTQALGLAQALIRMPSTLKCSRDNSFGARRSDRTALRNFAAISPSRRRSRFFENVEASRSAHPAQARQASETGDRTQSAPSVGAQAGSNRSPEAASPATGALA